MGVNCAAVLKYPKGVFTPCCKGVSLLALLSFQEGVGKVIIKQVHTTDYTPTEQVFIIQNIMQMHCKDIKLQPNTVKGPANSCALAACISMIYVCKTVLKMCVLEG